MPRTLLDQKHLSPAAARARIVRSVAAREGCSTGRQIAEVCGVSESYISGRMTGQTPWTLYDLKRMLTVFHMSDGEVIAFVKGERL